MSLPKHNSIKALVSNDLLLENNLCLASFKIDLVLLKLRSALQVSQAKLLPENKNIILDTYFILLS